MGLYSEWLVKILSQRGVVVTCSQLSENPAETIESECCHALHKIKAIIEDEDLSDFECVEQIACVLYKMGSDGESQHDFR